MKHDTTLKSIAKELGVSVSTISRALNNKSVVNEKTREKVVELAKKYGYVPNEIARSLQKCSTRTIAVVLPDISEVFFGKIVKEVSAVVSDHGYTLLLADTGESKEQERKHLQSLYQHRVDALVLASVDDEEKYAKTFADNSIPVIYIDNVPENTNLSAVTVDNFSAGKLGFNRLYDAGHRSIATIMGLQNEISASLRLKGFLSGAKEVDLSVSPDLIKIGDYKRQSGYEAMRELLDNREKFPFTAVYVASEKMTYGAKKAIAERGLKVPEDISILGFDVHNDEYGGSQNITSIKQPEEQIGKKVGEILIDALVNKTNIDSQKILLPPFIEEGDTVSEID